jgi:pimeloyl-ACP methyl ester carboxylesterase
MMLRGIRQRLNAHTSWSDRLMASLDERATVLETPQGAVQVARQGQGPRVLVAHGGPGGFDQGLAFYRHLQDGGCEVLAPSRPGYLRTPLDSGPRPEDQADLYAAILDALHIERATILGHSSGGPSAVHFAARYPDRTTALFLDAAILRPFETPLGAVERATLESGFLVRLSYELAHRWPARMTSYAVGGMSAGLTKDQRRAAVEWIAADRSRLQSMQQVLTSVAPLKHRKSGWDNDQANEADLTPLPFADVGAPTLIAHGANDRNIPIEHATDAADAIAGAELILVEEGHHALSLSRSYGPVAQRQVELAHG